MPAEATEGAIDLRDHWWWRSGWERGTRYYTWHLTFEHEPALQRLVLDYQEVLSGFSFLDPVPIEWLHLTLVGVGNATAVNDLQVRTVIDQVRGEIAGGPPISLTFQKPVVLREAVSLIVEPTESLSGLREMLRHAVTGSLGAAAPPEDARFPFVPHVTMAYVNADADGRGVIRALEHKPERVAARVSPVLALIELHRDNRQYEWRTLEEIPQAD